MSAEVNDILTQLAVIQREIINPVSGLNVVAYENIPYTISAVDMPLFVNFVGPLTQNLLMGSDEIAREFNEIRTFTMTFYHSPYGSGIEGEKMGLVTPFISLVYQRFGLYPHLKNIGGVVDAKLVGDSGMTVVAFNAQEYFGMRFTLQTTSRVRRVLGEDE